MHADINLLGIAYRTDGSVAARFSDQIKLDLDGKDQVQAFQAKTMHYENQFDVAAGTYTLKVVFGTSQDDFGKLEAPLLINAYETKDFALSGIAISTAYGPVSATDQNLDSMLLEGRSPLVAATPQGVFRFTPTGIAQFKATDKPAIYFELYDPLLTAGKEKKPNIAVQIRVLDAKSQAVKSDTGNLLLDSLVQIGSPVVPTGLRIPVDGLSPGLYRLELKALDSTGSFAVRTADFEVL